MEKREKRQRDTLADEDHKDEPRIMERSKIVPMVRLVPIRHDSESDPVPSVILLIQL